MMARKKNPWIQNRVKETRGSKTAKQRGEITPEVYQAAWEYARGKCVCCGWDPDQFWDGVSKKTKLEAAHYIRRHNFGQEGVQAWDVLMLCGPQVNSGTCHNWIDSTAAGKAWAIEKREEIRWDMMGPADRQKEIMEYTRIKASGILDPPSEKQMEEIQMQMMSGPGPDPGDMCNPDIKVEIKADTRPEIRLDIVKPPDPDRGIKITRTDDGKINIMEE